MTQRGVSLQAISCVRQSERDNRKSRAETRLKGVLTMTILSLKKTYVKQQSRRYSLPDVTSTLEEWQRAFHRDLPDLPDFKLWQEQARIRSRLAHFDPLSGEMVFLQLGNFVCEDSWLKERLTAIQRELRRRARRGRSDA